MVWVWVPACDLVIAWTYLEGESREVFIKEMNLAEDTWLRAKAWALWKATFHLCENDSAGPEHKIIIERILQ